MLIDGKLEMISGDPVLAHQAMISAGEQVKSALHVDRYEYGTVNSNLKFYKIKLVSYTDEMKLRVLQDLLQTYSDSKLLFKLEEFKLLSFKL